MNADDRFNLRFHAEIESLMRLIEIIEDPVKLAQYEEYLKQQRERRRARHDAKIARLMDSLTDKAEALVNAYKQEGASINKFYTDRTTANVAVMLVKRPVWNSAKGRMGTQIIMVYPDGSRVTTMEKSISIKARF